MDTHSKHAKITSYIIQAQEEELRRIANELHEGVAQTLFSIGSGLKVIGNQLEHAPLQAYTTDMIQSIEQTLEEIRFLSTELFPSSLHEWGLLPALKTYSKIFSLTFGIELHLEYHGIEKELPEHVEVSLFRVCQECLKNAAHYADTTDIRINITWKREHVIIEVEDFGVGFNVDHVIRRGEKLGIIAMKKRVELLGGEFTILSTLQKGTKVIISVPYEDQCLEAQYDTNNDR